MKKYLYYILIAIGLILGYLLSPSSSPERVNLKVLHTGQGVDQDNRSIRVFTSPDLTEYEDYKLSSPPLFIIGLPVYGVCIKQELENVQVHIDWKVLKLNRADLPPECVISTPIKRYNKDVSPRVLNLARFVSGAIIALGLVYVFWLIFCFIELTKKNHKKLILIGLSSIWFSGILYFYSVINFPVLYDIDLMNSYRSALSTISDSWFSHLDTLLMLSFLNIVDNVRVFLLVSIIGCTSILTWLISILYDLKISKRWSLIIWLIPLVPTFGYMTNYISRDLISAYLHLVLAFSFFAIKAKCYPPLRNLSKLDIIFLVAAVFAASIRSEAITTAMVFMFFFLFFTGLNRKAKVASSLLFILLFTLSRFSAHWMYPNDNARKYKIIYSVSHIIGSIITEEYKSDDKQRDNEIISRYFNLNKILNEHVENNIMPVHNGAVVDNPPDTKELALLAIKLSWDNPILFLKSRATMFLHTIGATSKTIRIPRESAKTIQRPQLSKLGDQVRFHKFEEAPSQRLWKLGEYIQMDLMYNSLSWSYNIIPQLLICFISLFLFKVAPLSAMASSVILARLPIFFILLPAAQFKYLFDLMAFGILIIPFLVWELSNLDD